MVADEMCNNGTSIQDVVKSVNLADIVPDTKNLKEVLWRPIQLAITGKESSTDLTTSEVNKVYEAVSMYLAKNQEIDLPFPSVEGTEEYLKSYEQYA